MTLTQLRYVIEVAGSHSMSEASRALFISQPSLSSSIKELEDEVGILYMNDFNRKVISKLLSERALEYHELLRCGIYVYMWKKHPLVEGLSDEELKDKTVSLEEMEKYPCLSFDQGRNNSFYFAEEVMSTYEYKHLIHADDRGTMLNLMVGLNGYTLCSGILCEDLNGSDFCAIRLRSDEMMSIVYITRKGTTLSPLGEIYLEEIRRFRVS